MNEDINFARLIEPVTRRLLGEPNKELSDRNQWRFGSRGSLVVEVRGDKAGTWYDHEAAEGGGVLDLIRRSTGHVNGAALEWIASNIDPSVKLEPPQVQEKAKKPKLGPIEATYDYLDAEGVLVFQVTRHRDPKDFRQRQPEPSAPGGWSWKVKGLPLLVYRLPELLGAPVEQVVFIPEGEKDVDRLRGLGLIATCNAGGAGKWRRDHSAWLKGRHVIILPDNDPQSKDPEGKLRFHPDGRPVLPGHDHAAQVALSLKGVASSIRILMLPDLPPKGDVSDWIEAGGTAERLMTLAEGLSQTKPAAARPSRRARQNSDLPHIQIQGGELHNEATAGEAALIAADRPIFQRGKNLVRPAAQEIEASRGRTALSACIIDISLSGMVDQLCSVAVWERYDARSKDLVAINPPRAVADTILSRAGEWSFPRLAGVITTPTIRADGSVLSEPGYDAATRLYHIQDETLALHPSVLQPSRHYAEKALEVLEELLSEFPFVDAVSRAVALSGLITPVVRGGLSVAPLHAFRAHTAGTGKSYMTDVISAICTGQPCPVTSAAPDDEAETEKRLTGLLLGGYPLCSLDNVNGELGGDLLCQAIERPIVRLRPLGRSDIMEVDSRATFFATGNNLRVRGDMVRRTVVCNLDAGVERPELREFKADPVQAVLSNRSRYVSACLTIVRAYLTASAAPKPRPVASFEDWSGTVRAALMWLGCEDPAKSMEEAREDDPELSDLAELLMAWRDAVGSKSFTVQEVVRAACSKNETLYGEPTDFAHPILREIFHRSFETRGEVNTVRLGKYLAKMEGKIVSSLRFKRDKFKDRDGKIRWMVTDGK